MRGVDPEVDGHRGDAFIGSCESARLLLDLSADLIEVCEPLVFTVQELTEL